MVLTVTPGSASADSYADTTAAAAYALANGLLFSGETTALEAALRRGTAWVDGMFRARFPGQRQNGRSQALEWPRKDAYDNEGELVAVSAIPDEIVRATIEASVRELASPNSLSPDVTMGGAKVLTAVDVIKWEVVNRPTKADDYKPTLTVVEGILAPLIGPESSTKRVLRS